MNEHQRLADKAVLMLLQEACRTKRFNHATGIAHGLRTHHGLEAGIKVADHFGHSNLAESLAKILHQRLDLAAAAAAEAAAAAPAARCVPTDVPSQSNNSSSTSYGREEVPSYDEGSAVVVSGALSRRAHMREAALALSAGAASAINCAGIRSSSDANTRPTPSLRPVNPFPPQSPVRRKNAFDSFKELKGSPSPKKFRSDVTKTTM
jgi:hypothetical protein